MEWKLQGVDDGYYGGDACRRWRCRLLGPSSCWLLGLLKVDFGLLALLGGLSMKRLKTSNAFRRDSGIANANICESSGSKLAFGLKSDIAMAQKIPTPHWHSTHYPLPQAACLQYATSNTSTLSVP